VIIPIQQALDLSTFDGVLIVGAGPVGIALARSLSARGRRSLLLEAGGEVSSADSANDLAVHEVGATLNGAILGRTRQIGGGANLWGGQIAMPRLEEAGPTGDASTGWPIPLEEIHARANAAIRLLGHDFALEGLQGKSFDNARTNLEKAGLDLVATAWLKKPKLPRDLWREIRSSDHIVVAHGGFVCGITLSEAGRAVGVQLRLRTGGECRLVGTPVVLACGTLEIVRLLLAPVATGRAPWAELDWLGRGFNDHLDAAVAKVYARDNSLLLDVFDPAIHKGIKYSCKTFAQVPCGEGEALSAVGMLTLPYSIRNSIAELRMLANGLKPRNSVSQTSSYSRALLAAGRDVLPLAWRYLRHKRIGTSLMAGSTLRVSLEQPVRRVSCITLAERRDSLGIPQISVNWVKGTEEGRAFLAKVEMFKYWAEGSGAAFVEIDPLLSTDPTAFAGAANEGLHHAGGARMAASRTNGVVDTNLAVFNATGLYCCGAAVFPRLGYVNPTLTAVALADRLAAHLAETPS
jgi:choline dehydrogenase-like flavoprotein